MSLCKEKASLGSDWFHLGRHWRGEVSFSAHHNLLFSCDINLPCGAIVFSSSRVNGLLRQDLTPGVSLTLIWVTSGEAPECTDRKYVVLYQF